MRTPRPRAAWVTLTGTGAAASVALGLLVFASVLASLAIPREGVALRTVALQRVIASSAPADRTVVGTASVTGLGGNLTVQAADITAVGAALRKRLMAGGVPVTGHSPAWASLTSSYVSLQGAAPGAGHSLPQVELTYSTALARYGRVVAGRLPAGVEQIGKQSVVQVAVTTATAARLGLRVGARLRVGVTERAVVTGIIRPVDPASVFWTQNHVAASPALTAGSAGQLPYWVGAVFIGPGALAEIQSDLDTVGLQVTWVYGVALRGLAAGQASALAAGLGSMAASGVTFTAPGFAEPIKAAINSQLPAVLSPFVAAENAAAPVLGLLYVSLAVLGAVVVLLGARLVAQRRAAEFTLMRARGAALYQLSGLVLRANVVIAAVAAAAAAVLAIGLIPGTRGDGDALGWWLAALTIAVTLVGPVLISVVPQRVASAAGPRDRWVGGRKHTARRIVVETVLLALAIGGLVVLRNEGFSSGSNGLYTSAAPVLIAIAVAVVVLRGYPPLIRQLARIAGLSRGVVAFVGLARATRTPPGTVLPSFALVLVLAMVAFPDMISTSVTRAQVAASWQQVGADAVIEVRPPLEVIPPALQQQISALPGVVATASAAIVTGSLSSGSTLSLIYVNPARWAAVVDRAPGPRFPRAALSGSTATGLPAVAAPATAELVGTTPAEVSLAGSPAITIRLAGRVSSIPGATTDDVVLVPQEPSGTVPDAVNLMLLAGPRLDGARLTAAVHRALPDASVTVRSSVLAALGSAPVLQAAKTALAQGLAAAAGFGVLVLLLSLLLTAQTRELTLASLATMGLRRGQAQLLLAAETLPPVMAAALGGVACAWLLAPLVGPSLNLAAYSGTGSAIVVTPAVFPLAVSAAGLVLVALLVLAAQAVITYYRGSARALRIAD
jgi:putative ABC transport system permease protein